MAEAVWNGAQAKARAREFGALGLNKAAERLAALAQPLTPNLDGDLEESQQVHQTTPDELASQVQYDTPYAVLQHEALEFNHTKDPNPAAQAKYLEDPQRTNQSELMGIVGATVKRGF